MTPDELRSIGTSLYGKWGWQKRMSEALKVDGATVRRWVSGAVPVPGPAEAALNCFIREHARRRKAGKPKES